MEVLRGRQSEGAGAEMERVDGSPCPPGGLVCGRPRASSCCSDTRLSVGLSEACWAALSSFQWSVHSEKQAGVSVNRDVVILHQLEY